MGDYLNPGTDKFQTSLNSKIYVDKSELIAETNALFMTVKKYGTHSALNMFDEYSMIEPAGFVNFFGFTEFEVEGLCKKYEMSLEEVSAWYNGYFKESGSPIYNPTPVVKSLMRKQLSNYWNQTETYEALKAYIQMDFDDLRNKITAMMGGESIEINTRSFTNDMSTFATSDDLLTLLVHLGYLSYPSLHSDRGIGTQIVMKKCMHST